jgi:hypothetical protein
MLMGHCQVSSSGHGTLAASILMLALSSCGAPSNVECPVPQMRAADGVLVETSAEIAAYSELFESGYSGNAIPEAVRLVRKKYPGATTAEIRNFLIAAYCPIAQQSAVGAPAQQASIQQFETALDANLAP